MTVHEWNSQVIASLSAIFAQTNNNFHTLISLHLNFLGNPLRPTRSFCGLMACSCSLLLFLSLRSASLSFSLMPKANSLHFMYHTLLHLITYHCCWLVHRDWVNCTYQCDTQSCTKSPCPHPVFFFFFSFARFAHSTFHVNITLGFLQAPLFFFELYKKKLVILPRPCSKLVDFVVGLPEHPSLSLLHLLLCTCCDVQVRVSECTDLSWRLQVGKNTMHVLFSQIPARSLAQTKGQRCLDLRGFPDVTEKRNPYHQHSKLPSGLRKNTHID